MLTGISIGLATLAILLITAGLVLASDRRRHIPLMMAAFGCDMVSLVIVEVVKPMMTGEDDAVSQVLAFEDTMKIVHAIFATASIVGYILQIVSGRKIMKGDYAAIAGHKKTARFFLVTRALAYVTMFFV